MLVMIVQKFAHFFAVGNVSAEEKCIHFCGPYKRDGRCCEQKIKKLFAKKCKSSDGCAVNCILVDFQLCVTKQYISLDKNAYLRGPRLLLKKALFSFQTNCEEKTSVSN